MAKIHSYYVVNIQKELHYYGKEVTESELHTSALAETMYLDPGNINLLDESSFINVADSQENLVSLAQETDLQIKSIVNLEFFDSFQEMQENSNVSESSIVSFNMNFNPEL